SSVFNNNKNKETPVTIEVDPLSLDKGKGKEVPTGETTSVIIPDQPHMNVDNVTDASENS
ncbi:6103_t:CDS:1, partial [Funneliformis mosseae]